MLAVMLFNEARTDVQQARRGRYWASATVVLLVGGWLIWRAVTARHPNYLGATALGFGFIALVGVLSWRLDRTARRMIRSEHPGARVWAVATGFGPTAYFALTDANVILLNQQVGLMRVKRTPRVWSRAAIRTVEAERILVFPRSCPGIRIVFREPTETLSFGFIKWLGFGQATVAAADALAILSAQSDTTEEHK